VIGPLVFCLLAFSIYGQLIRQTDWRESFNQVLQALTNGSWQLMSVVALMLVNWGIEARKWQVVIRKIQPISFFTSWKAVHSGLTLSFFMPNRIGEYIGRVLYIQEGKRIEAASVTIVCSMAQLLVTWLAGIAGIIYLQRYFREPGNTMDYFWLDTLLFVAIPAAAILTLLYFRLSWVVRRIHFHPRIDRYIERIRVLEDFNATILVRILSLSIARYAVFVGQYYLLFVTFMVPLDAQQVFGSVSVIFLVLSIVPTIAIITDLGVRWKTSMDVIQMFSVNMAGILATSLAIWIINLVIPALIGSLLILGIKIFRYKNKPGAGSSI
jgi:hypothetical protein